MRNDVLLAGLGGQGTLLAGRVLARAAIDADMAVTWYPSYSPEVRGGTVECTVVISDTTVGSPIVGRPNNAVFLALSMFEDNYNRVADNGSVLINSSSEQLHELNLNRNDLRIIPVEATALARDAGSERVANMIMLGAYVQLALPDIMENLITGLETVLPDRHKEYMPVNREAIDTGAEIGREA